MVAEDLPDLGPRLCRMDTKIQNWLMESGSRQMKAIGNLGWTDYLKLVRMECRSNQVRMKSIGCPDLMADLGKIDSLTELKLVRRGKTGNLDYSKLQPMETIRKMD